MRARTRSAAVVAATAALLLSGCRSNVGVAATVNGERISESTVSKYVTREGADATLAAQAEAQGGGLPNPKSLVLQTLVLQRLYENTLAAHGGIPTDGQLAAVRDPALQQQFNSTSVGRALQREVSGALSRIGVSSGFAQVVVRYSELFYVVLQRLRPQSQEELAAVIRKAGAHVDVNPRYGSWDARTQTIDSSDAAGLPGYLKLQPTPTPSAVQLGLPGS